jgi:hypothetical protein
MPSRTMVLKPGSSYFTVYVPGGSSMKRYAPASSVTASLAPWMAGLVRLTDTPGITASEVSVTRPLMAPVVVWAIRGIDRINTVIRAQVIRPVPLIILSSIIRLNVNLKNFSPTDLAGFLGGESFIARKPKPYRINR